MCPERKTKTLVIKVVTHCPLLLLPTRDILINNQRDQTTTIFAVNDETIQRKASSQTTSRHDSLEDIELAPNSNGSTSSRHLLLHTDDETPQAKRKLVNTSTSFRKFPMQTKRTIAPRSESMAYPAPNSSTYRSRLNYFLRQNSRALLATLAFFLFLLIVASDYFHDFRRESASILRGGIRGTSSGNWGGAVHKGYFRVEDAILSPNKFSFAAITDLDQLSRVPGELKWRSVLQPGVLTRENGTYKIELEEPRTLLTKHNEGGRGAEFSELTIYENRLLTFDDRTGDVFEILNNDKGTESFCFPRFVITEGAGETDKGMKWEWSTVKDKELYMGSMGKEYTRPDGSVVNSNNLWIAILNNRGELRRENWKSRYEVVREALGAQSPGYLIIEAVNWSDKLHKWVFLPRRISSEAYDENKDERMGGDKLVLVSEDFTKSEVVKINFDTSVRNPLKGFSTFAFVPNTGDRHALAIRSVEEDCVGGEEDKCKQRSYFIVFDVLTGEVLSQELQHPEKLKFEGVEFVNAYVKPNF